MKGWTGKRAVIDLTRGVAKVEAITLEELKHFLGGRGLNAWMLYATVKAGVDPLGPENVLCFGTGPLTGTQIPSNGRYNVSARSPATGIFGDANSGGFWGSELKYAGFDQIVITGQSPKPVYLLIHNGDVSIRDAGHLWGKSVWETEKILKAELEDEDIQIASIGQAGENQVRFAGVMNNLSRAAGRTGMGAVMGAKKLKAVVVRGTQGIQVADPVRLGQLSQELFARMQKANSWRLRSTYGTAMLVELYNSMGVLPTRNYQRGVYEKADEIDGHKLLNMYVVKPKACFACPVHCSHFYEIKEGEFAGLAGEGPEFETMCAFGSRCGNDNLASILVLNNLCNQYGLDTISAGAVLSFAMECYENGLITPRDTDGLELTWGNYKAMIELTHKIARREGFGKLLAQGVREASRAIPGSERYALHIKGLETPEQEIRGLKSWGLGWAVSSRGADHCRSFPLAETTWSPEEAESVFGTKEAANRFAYNGKAEMVKYYEEISAVGDSLELCRIAQLGLNMPMDLIAEAVTAATGWRVAVDDLMRIGERIVNIERLFNLRQGLTPADDCVPARYREEKLPDGPGAGQTFDLEPMLDRYYEIRGWDKTTGEPHPDTLKRLELKPIKALGKGREDK